jgi:hypothetical protein
MFYLIDNVEYCVNFWDGGVFGVRILFPEVLIPEFHSPVHVYGNHRPLM